ncbi:MAG: hypothetical protein HQL66_03130 [Magnetococcales bacterium]|nr:hypothetical protein [Magnetococcales bacterium]
MAGRATTQEGILTAMDGETVKTTRELAAAMGKSANEIASTTSLLVRRGLLERIENGRFRLTPTGEDLKRRGGKIFSGPMAPFSAAKSPTTRRFRQRLWTALYNRNKAATIDDLLQLAVDGTEKNPRNNAHKYLRYLEKTGFVIRMERKGEGRAPTSNGLDRWLLTRKSGWRAPVPRENGEVYDPNTGKTYPLAAKSVAMDTPLTGSDINRLADAISGYREEVGRATP